MVNIEFGIEGLATGWWGSSGETSGTHRERKE